MSNARLNENQTAVLRHLAGEYSVEAGFFSFAGISAETKLDRKAVRLACRALKRKGLARFATGLWTEDGEMRGAGYAATKEGVEWVADHSEPLDPMRGVEFPFARNH